MLIEKMFGWMKLDDNNTEISDSTSTVLDEKNDDVQQYKSDTIDDSEYLDKSPIQNTKEQEYFNEEPISHDNSKEETIPEENHSDKTTQIDAIIEEIMENINILEESSRKHKIVQDDTVKEKIITENVFTKYNNQNNIMIYEDIQDENNNEEQSYLSKRKIILGVHIQFIDVAREVVQEQCIKTIPLMREFHLQKSSLDEILEQLHAANIIGQYNQILMTSQELEKFLDIYEPTLFNCQHTIFDKEIFLCIGEIIFDNGVDSIYDSMNEDEVLDYLTIMEKLNIIAYNSETNEYDIISSKEDFLNICECIPRSFSNEEYNAQEQDYQGKDFDNMTGLEFERYCGYILHQNSFSEIKITQASSDHGIDILAEKAGINYAFQCKCYSDNVGNDAVQQAHTGKSLYHMDIAVVITNRYFTQQAQDEAKQLGVKLWDRDKLLELVNNAKETN